MGNSKTMNFTALCVVLAVASLCSRAVGELPSPLGWSGEPLLNRTSHQKSCLENQQYLHRGFCCQNCQAGTFVSKPCTADQERGTCSPCDQGTYAEHPTGMPLCLQCTQCQPDQIMTEQCTSTQNTQCECKPGFFCVPDQPCEVCKKCTRCKADEEEVRKCTATSNSKCVKRPPFPSEPTHPPTGAPPSSTEDHSIAIYIVPVLCLLAVCVFVGCCLWRRLRPQRPESGGTLTEDEQVKIPIEDKYIQSAEERENSRNAGLEEAEEPRPESRPLLQETQAVGTKGSALEDEDRGLGDSLPNTTSSSQTSLSAPPTAACTEDSPRHSPSNQRQSCPAERDTEPWIREDGQPRTLIPLRDEESSLIKTFDLFDALDVRVHNKFFRSIGVSDNAIKIVDANLGSDKVYELLTVWRQREGLRANINDLLCALLNLDQRYTAEDIASKARQRGFYRFE